jgi:hypothetical protein
VSRPSIFNRERAAYRAGARRQPATEEGSPCRILAHELRDKRDVGDGELHRIASEVIRANRLFDAPLSTESGKYAVG